MRIVDVDGNLIRKVPQRAVAAQVVGNDGLQGCGNEEVLLGQTKQLTLGVVVGRIQNLGEDLRVGILLHCLHVGTLREQVHIEHRGALCLPQAQNVDRLTVGTGDHDVIGNSLDLFVIAVNDIALAVLPGFLDVTAEANGARLVGSRNKNDVTAGQPVVGQLDLLTVDELLLEQTVFIQQRKTGCGVVERGRRIHKASRKSAKTAVAETRIGLVLTDGIERIAELGEDFAIGFGQTQVAEVVLQRAADQKFHAHIVQGLAGLTLDFFFIFGALLGQNVLDAHHDRAVDLVFICFRHGNAEIAGELHGKRFSDGFFGKNLIHVVFFLLNW